MLKHLHRASVLRGSRERILTPKTVNPKTLRPETAKPSTPKPQLKNLESKTRKLRLYAWLSALSRIVIDSTTSLMLIVGQHAAFAGNIVLYYVNPWLSPNDIHVFHISIYFLAKRPSSFSLPSIRRRNHQWPFREPKSKVPSILFVRPKLQGICPENMAWNIGTNVPSGLGSKRFPMDYEL